MIAVCVLHPRVENGANNVRQPRLPHVIGAIHTVSGKASDVEVYDFVVL